jgi:hydroxymethylglutaryl-CoA synthase
MRGILGCGAYLPYRRLDLAEVAAVAGRGGRKGSRSVASFDEDATTMAVEAARVALRSTNPASPESLWFATVAPAYLDRTNANAVHAALRLDRDCPAYDIVGSIRGSVGALRAALAQPGPAVAVASDVRVGPAGGPDEAYFGDGAAAVVVGEGPESAVLAEIVAWASVSEEFVDRWRTPGQPGSKVWEERYGELRYTGSGMEAYETALKQAGMESVDRVVVTGPHGRAVRTVTNRLGAEPVPIAVRLANEVGNTGAAHPFVLLTALLEHAAAGETIALVVLADGAEAIILRTTSTAAGYQPVLPVDAQIAGGAPLPYGRYLAWREMLPVEPPRRPEPARVSAPAAGRAVPWKFGLVASSDRAGRVNLPPVPADEFPHPMADAVGTVTTFTVDRLSYTPSPPMVFAVVDFDGGGRLPLELTDVDASEVAVGDRVELTFRRLSSADGLHNYFWKARPRRGRSG